MKQKIQEAAGIPKDVHFLAAEIFEYIKYELKERRVMSLPAGKVVTFSKFGDFKLGEKEVSGQLPGIKIEYRQGKLKGGRKLSIMGMAVSNREDTDQKQKTIQTVPGYEYFSITFGGTEEKISFRELERYLEENSEELISSIAHELTHFYINRRHVSKRNSRGESQYNVINQMLTQESKVFRDFFYALYLTSPTEIHVRNSEIFTTASYRGTTKEDFKEFLKENKKYQQIRDLLNFSVERDLLTPIRNHIEEESKKVGIKLTPEQKEKQLNQVLETLHKKLTTAHMDYGTETHRAPWEVQLLGPDKEVQDFVKHNMKGIRTMEQWLKTSEKQVRQGAEKTLRRIHKVYSELPSREEVGKLQENIIDLDLFCQFYKKPKRGESLTY